MNISKLQGKKVLAISFVLAMAVGFLTAHTVANAQVQPLLQEGDKQTVDGKEMEIRCHSSNMTIIYEVCMLEPSDSQESKK